MAETTLCGSWNGVSPPARLPLLSVLMDSAARCCSLPDAEAASPTVAAAAVPMNASGQHAGGASKFLNTLPRMDHAI